MSNIPTHPMLAGTLAIILAAGRSSRTAPAHKLLACDASGQPMLLRTLEAVLASAVEEVLVLLPPERPDMAALLHPLLESPANTPAPSGPIASGGRQPVRRLRMTCVRQPELGLSRSLHTGVRAAMRRRASSLLVCLGDMPLVSPALLDTLLHTQRATNAPAVAPDRHGQPGNPVLWSAQCYDRLLGVQGDQGGRAILRDLGSAVRLVPAPAAMLEDFDTPERLSAFAHMNGSSPTLPRP
ncbi:MAG: NTP transferase domain-containing protein [Acetobacter sp.]|uniref:nucleotidyltransferase family protein n=1 Tax=Acetobacter sp. TaxID=440 RepID=UPI003CFD00C1